MANKKESIHFIGIKGVGMTALAIFAKEKGYQVSGSDVAEEFVTDRALAKAGILVSPFDPKNLKSKPDLVVVSAAYTKDNPEVNEAYKKKLPVKPYSEVLAIFAQDFQTIAVAGIHGKTTTAALLSFLLVKAGLDPSYLIGSGEIPVLGSTGHYGQGDYFVLEADEYRKSPTQVIPKFFDLSPQIEIITSIEMDHPDMFVSAEEVYKVFYQFACRIPRNGFVILCLDYPKSKKLLRSLVDRHFETYGFEEGSLWKIIDYEEDKNITTFRLSYQNDIYGPFQLEIAGRGNVYNAAAAIIVALKLGVSEKLIKKYLPNFTGVKRRFEKIGQIGNLIILDDYAHHPRAVAVTLEAARKKFPHHKLYCIFQPHTYSRTKELKAEFAQAFNSADKVIITDIFSSARETDPTITGEDLVLAVRQYKKQVKFVSSWPKIIKELLDHKDIPAVVITMGAGDIYKLGKNLLKEKNEN